MWKEASVRTPEESPSQPPISRAALAIGWRMSRAMMPVMALKRMWARAVRLTAGQAPMAARAAVAVVPRF